MLTPSDIKAIKKFREFPNYKQRVVSMFAPNVIGENDKKFATLISCIGAPEIVDKNGKVKRGRINHLHLGEPGLAKTTIGKEVEKLMRIVSMSAENRQPANL